jgi:hypothetical protein
VRRGDFEHLVRRYLDTELLPRGFRLVPQPPADADDEKPQALYEADPNEFGQRYPALDGRAGGNVQCVDIWVRLDLATGGVSGDLDGAPIDTIADTIAVMAAADSTPKQVNTEGQLQQLARRIAMALDRAAKRD